MEMPAIDDRLCHLWDALTASLDREQWDAPLDIGLTVLRLVENNLIPLQRTLEGRQTPRVSWSDPWIEAQYPAEWNWDCHAAIFGGAQTTPQAGLFPTSTPQLAQWAEELAADAQFRVFHFLTRGAALLQRGDLSCALLPEEARLELLALPEERREAHLASRLQGFWFSDPDIMRFSGTVEKLPYEVAVVVEVHPLVLDEDAQRAYFSVITGLVFEQGEPMRWEPEAREALWEDLRRKVSARIRELVRHEMPPDVLHKSMTATAGLPDLPEPIIAPRRTFPLPVGPALVDRGTHEVVSAAIHTRGLFHRWSDLPIINQELRREAARLYAEEGLEGLRSRKGGLRQGPRGEDEPYLAMDSRHVRDFMIRVGMETGYRRVDDSARDVIASGGAREYACRVFRTDKGYVEIGLSWDALAGPWMDEWHEELARRVSLRSQRIEELRAEATDSLFPEVQEEEIARIQRVVDQASEAITIWRRGHTIMGIILGQVFHQRSNWVAIPAEAIRMALWDVQGAPCPRNWKQDVDNVLASLATVTFSVRGLSGERVRGFGRLLGEVWYEDHPILVPRGSPDDPPHPPREVDRTHYLMDVQPGFVGCLQVFEAGVQELHGPVHAILFDWAKQLARQGRRSGQQDTGALPGPHQDPYLYYDPARFLAHGAKEFTTTQRALDDCLEREITKHWEFPPGGKKRLARNLAGGIERLHTREDCSLLPEGQFFVVAGGNGRRPGLGYTVGGRTSTRRRGGWLERVGGYLTDWETPRGRLPGRHPVPRRHGSRRRGLLRRCCGRLPQGAVADSDGDPGSASGGHPALESAPLPASRLPPVYPPGHPRPGH